MNAQLLKTIFRRFLPAVAVMSLMVGATGCAVSDAQVISNANQFQTQLKPAEMTDAQLSSYLQQIGDRVVSAAKQFDAEHKGPAAHFKSDSSWMFSNRMQFHFVNSKTVNAFTTGGEHMYIYNALFQMCKSEEELASVMAHEYAHVYSRHVATGQSRQLATLATAALVGGAAGYAVGGKEHGGEYAAAGAGIGAAGGQFVNMGFTRGDENQADQWGFQFFTRAGWGPRHFSDFFKAMIAAGYDKTPEYLSDHPTLRNRVDHVNQWVKDLGPDVDRYIKGPIADRSRFEQLQERANAIAKSTPDDTSIKNSQQLAAALPHSCVMPAEPEEAKAAREEIDRKARCARARSSAAQ